MHLTIFFGKTKVLSLGRSDAKNLTLRPEKVRRIAMNQVENDFIQTISFNHFDFYGPPFMCSFIRVLLIRWGSLIVNYSGHRLVWPPVNVN